MPGALHVENPPSFFKLSPAPPRKSISRINEIKEEVAQEASKSEAIIPGMWAGGSITDFYMTESARVEQVQAEDVSQTPARSLEPTQGGRARSSSEGEEKSSVEGSFETAYTRPQRHIRRRSRSFDFGKPNVPLPQVPSSSQRSQQPDGNAAGTLATQETILANLDSFVKAHSPIAWPLPPKMMVLIDSETGERWKNVSPVAEA